MKKYFLFAVSLAVLSAVSDVSADSLLNGSATINFDQNAWNNLASGYGPTPVLTLSAFFNQTQANALTYDQTLTNVQVGASYTNQVYAMNGPTVTNLAGRTTQPTTFVYYPGHLTNHTGSIGLGGIARFDVYGGAYGELLYGDYTLQFDTNRIALGGSGWYLKGNIPPAAAAFDLLNVTTLETNNTLTISGDLGVSFEVANFLYATPGDTLAIVGNLTFTGQTVATLVNGLARINYDQSAWDALGSGYGVGQPVLTLAAFFTQAQANALTTEQIFYTVQTNAPYTNEIYGLNAPTVTNLAGSGIFPARTTQPTTFTYDRGNLTNQTGGIGLGGIAEFAVTPAIGGGVLLYGDYTLQYAASRIALGGSGWYLEDHIAPASPAFDLINISVVETSNLFTISGDLGVTYEIANFMLATPSDTLAVVGTFNFTGYTVPLTTPVLSSIKARGGNLFLQATNGLAGSSFTLLSATNAALPSSSWMPMATGTFDGNGNASNSIAINPLESARFFRLQQP